MLPDNRALVLLVNRPPVAVKFRVPWRRVSYRLGRLPRAPQLLAPADVMVPAELPQEELTNAAG